MQTSTMKTHKALITTITLAFSSIALNAQDKPAPDRPPGDTRRPLAGLFGIIDANHDGNIDTAEIDKAVEGLRKLDRNSDGKINPDEFSAIRPQGEQSREGERPDNQRREQGNRPLPQASPDQRGPGPVQGQREHWRPNFDGQSRGPQRQMGQRPPMQRPDLHRPGDRQPQPQMGHRPPMQWPDFHRPDDRQPQPPRREFQQRRPMFDGQHRGPQPQMDGRPPMQDRGNPPQPPAPPRRDRGEPRGPQAAPAPSERSF